MTLKDIPGLEGKYAATSTGHIYSYRMRGLLSEETSNGYKRLGFSLPLANRTTRSVHRLVCYAFHTENYEPGLEAHHKDDNRANNRPSNLEWV